ncbi:MAG TPA: pantoate--beta-alanine ligase [Longimicrobiales bacterium]
MITTRLIAELRARLTGRRAAGERIALVPTMGALHDGHLQLCEVARRNGDIVVMSIFVNPLQFGPGEDLEKYPRGLEHDARLAADCGVAVLFAPATDEILPDGSSFVRVHAPGLDSVLCGRFRPGHFEGVLTVVAKLFNIVRPDVAVFGQKDLQQATLIRRMVRDLNYDIELIVAPTVREPDGLALSSRNAYLTPEERTSGLALNRALQAAQRAFADGERDPAALVAVADAILRQEPGVSPQYVEVVDPDTLRTPGAAARGHAVAIAAHVGATRLIDNVILS